jgi:FdhD protein
MPDAVTTADRQIWRDGHLGEGTRLIPEETAIALTYNGGTYAVMMGTPRDLKDFAIGFSLSEGIVRSPDEIETLDIVELDDGIELRMWLKPSSADLVNERRRHIAGPTGCGICGVESIAEAVRPAAIVPKGRTFAPSEIMAAMASISTSRPARCMRRHSGRRRTASWRCARMSAATTPSTSSPAHWRRSEFSPSKA